MGKQSIITRLVIGSVEIMQCRTSNPLYERSGTLDGRPEGHKDIRESAMNLQRQRRICEQTTHCQSNNTFRYMLTKFIDVLKPSPTPRMLSLPSKRAKVSNTYCLSSLPALQNLGLRYPICQTEGAYVWAG